MSAPARGSAPAHERIPHCKLVCADLELSQRHAILSLLQIARLSTYQRVGTLSVIEGRHLTPSQWHRYRCTNPECISELQIGRGE